MSHFFSHRRILLPAAILAFVVTLTSTEFLAYQYRSYQLTQQRNEVFTRASLVRSRLEYEIHTTLNLALGLTVFVASHPELTRQEFNRVAGALRQRAPYIRNIGLIQDFVAGFVYPLKGNESVLGLDYRNYPDQMVTIQQAINEKNTVIAGPVELVQGGQGFISRIPIYCSSDQSLWGLASVVIDATTLYEHSGLTRPDVSLLFALRGKNGQGSTGDYFFGNPDLFRGERAILLDIPLPVGSWQLAVMPKDGWESASVAIEALRIFGLLMASVLSLLLYALLKAYQRNRTLALYDPLTQLANRRFFERYLQQSIAVARRNRRTLCLLYLDLNNFKPINDLYGHKKGDQVLVTIARRLQDTLRNSDMVSRVGGDEFVVILFAFPGDDGIVKVVDKLRSSLGAPIELGKDGVVTVETSIGVSVCPDDGITAEQLLKAADKAMYEDKRRLKGAV
ncbi:MAG: sensor domain-containing diguanylate cyclase [Desulfuromonas sp.]|nr:MAG: sensor domain-containing diguanylate cyclase [Desulfuromonas sp.]